MDEIDNLLQRAGNKENFTVDSKTALLMVYRLKEQAESENTALKVKIAGLEGQVSGLGSELIKYEHCAQSSIASDDAQATAKAHDARIERRGRAKGLREAAMGWPCKKGYQWDCVPGSPCPNCQIANRLKAKAEKLEEVE